jgi:hypothetical protein
MATNKDKNDFQLEKIDSLLRATQDLFILQALLAGVNVDDVRKILKIDKHRVSNISKHLKNAKQR